jgi:hypothetical protein
VGAGPAGDGTGAYVNGDVEYVVSAEPGGLALAIDGDSPERLVFHDGSSFSLVDAGSGRPGLTGRFHWDPVTSRARAIHLGGRLGRRNPPAE